MEQRTYKIDFFQLSHISTPETPTLQDGFNAVHGGSLALIHDMGGYTRDLWAFGPRSSPLSMAGQFRKFRTADLPEIGAAGGHAEELDLEPGQGLVERNFFVYYPEHQLLGWHVNSHGSSPGQFARFLGELWGTKVSIEPVLQPDAIRRLMANGIDATKITLTVARPKNPNLYPNDEFGKSIIGLMNAADADSMHLDLRVDARRSDTTGKLASKVKLALKEIFSTMEVTTARAIVEEDGFLHPIDLVADRVSSRQSAETNASYPPSETMYRTIDAARLECDGAIHDYFGQVGTSLQ